VDELRARIYGADREGKAGLVSGFTASQYPRAITWVRFTDGAGLHWEIDTGLQLRKLDYRDW
jgi:hypothetical protein